MLITFQSSPQKWSRYRPLAEGYELSGKADCSETLRADYRAAHPTQETRLEELETLVAALLFGGEGV